MKKAATAMLASALVGCASVPPVSEPAIDADTQTSAAVASGTFWRWLGKAVLQVIRNTKVNISVEQKAEPAAN